MKNFRFLSILGGMIFLASALIAGNPHQKEAKKTVRLNVPKGVSSKDYQPGTVIFKLKKEYRSSCLLNTINIPALIEIFGKVQAQKIAKIFPHAEIPSVEKNKLGKLTDLSLIYRLKYSSPADPIEVANMLLSTGLLEYADLDYLYQVSTDYHPNDPDTLGAKNYYLEMTHAYEAWAINKGDTSVVIGIVDSGSDIDHPDLAANIKKNYKDPINQLDDDSDGYVDNYTGWDLGGSDYNNIQGDNDPNIKGNNNNHGSHVSGDASAVTDNGIGVSGMGFKSKLLIVKCGADNDNRGTGGEGLIISGYDGIQYAADHGANIINCSWGGAGGGSFGQDVINYASINKGCLVVVAAGNDNTSEDSYPAAYDNVLNVGSTTASDKKSSFSNFGYNIDVCAPGNGIYSTIYNNAYSNLSGTSMASPITAGAAAIVKAQFPTYTGLQVGEQLRISADNIDSKNTAYKFMLGRGRINLYRALTVSSPSIRSINRRVTDRFDGSLLPGDTISIYSDYMNYLNPTSHATVVLNTIGGGSSVTILNNSVTLGAVGTLETKAVAEPFRVVIKDIPDNTNVNFRFTYTDSSTNYSDFQVFTLTLNRTYLNITVNQVASTATSIGRIGFNDGSAADGLGFRYHGNNLIYECSYIIGVSPSLISDNARGVSTTNEDFKSVVRTTRHDGPANFYSSGVFSDADAANPIGISVKHQELAWSDAPNDKYIMLQYKIVNDGDTALDNLYAGYFADFDIGANSTAAASNKSKWDTVRRLGYVYETKTGGLYGGIKILTKNAPATFHSAANDATYGNINLNDGFSDEEKFDAISTVNGPEAGDAAGKPNGEDVMVTVGSGPFHIQAHDSITIGYAILAGDNLEDLNNMADSAQVKYDLSPLSTNIANQQVKNPDMIAIYPNPASNEASAYLNLNENGTVKLELIDLLGKKIKELNWQNLSPGKQEFKIDLHEIPGGVYFCKSSFNNSFRVSKIMIKKP